MPLTLKFTVTVGDTTLQNLADNKGCLTHESVRNYFLTCLRVAIADAKQVPVEGEIDEPEDEEENEDEEDS